MSSRPAHSRTAPLSRCSWTTIWTTLNLWIIAVSSLSATPYVPTTILPLTNTWAGGNKTNDGVYILSPTNESVDLLFLNISSTLEAGSLSTRTLTSGIPFLKDGTSTTTFTASVDDNETLTVFAGDCSASGDQAIWTYAKAITSATGQSWMKHTTLLSDSSSGASSEGSPYFLGASLSFSVTIEPVMSAPVTYAYGGMCPWSNASSYASWQYAAQYSNRMIKALPPGAEEGDKTSYTISSAPSYDPPIAEAGFSFTALTPAISNRSSIVTQEISHVLLGGHTQNAFINMSTAAIWSLPEEAWNTIFINSPGPESYGNPDLAIRQGEDGVVEPRSGHTAVLNEDGTALIVLGGWVGNLTTAAKPQLVVLEMGTSLSEWHWSIPATAQPSGPGIYGHGAALLPGNVMMVYGGYSTAGNQKRASTQGARFLNLTSMSWSDKYTNPTANSADPSAGPGTNPSSPANNDSDYSRNLALGLGLGVGGPLLILLILLAIFLRRRQVRNREREEVVRGMSQDAQRFVHVDNHDEMVESRDYGTGWLPSAWNDPASSSRDWYTGGSDPYLLGSRSLGYESLRGATRSLPALPPMAVDRSPTRSRSAARGLYLPTTGIGSGGGYEFGSSAGVLGHKVTKSGGIHPIYEAEDEDGEITTGNRRSQAYDDAESDPFITPTTTPRGLGPNNGTMYFPPPSRSSATPSPEYLLRPTHGGQDAEVTEWVGEVDAADALLTARISPHGSTTTTINQTPPKQSQPGTTTPSRLLPSRPNSIILPLPAANDSSDEARTGSNLSESARSQFSFTRSSSQRLAAKEDMQRANSSSGSSGHTYSTAKTKFVQLRDEGPALLLGGGSKSTTVNRNKRRRTMVEDDSPADDQPQPPGSPSKSKPMRNSRGWLGSLRRVFSGGSPSGSSRGDESPVYTTGDKSAGEASDYEPRLVGMGPDGKLLRRKQGRDAWMSGGAGGGHERGEGEEGDDDWDVERAVEQRLVQIMFTVPKERLRVVNADEIENEEQEVVVVVDHEREGDDDGDVFGGRYRQVEEDLDEEKEEMRQRESRQAYEDLEKEVLRLTETRSIAESEKDILAPGLTETRSIADSEKDILRLTQVTSAEYGDPVSRQAKGKERDVRRESTLTVPDRPRTPNSPASIHVSIHTAEAVTIERPKTKVLQMVESIEHLSRSGTPKGGTPSGSPQRSEKGSI